MRQELSELALGAPKAATSLLAEFMLRNSFILSILVKAAWGSGLYLWKAMGL